MTILQRCSAWPQRAAVHILVCKYHGFILAEGKATNPSDVEEGALRGSKGLGHPEVPSSCRATAMLGTMSHLAPIDGMVASGVKHREAARRVLGTCSSSSCSGAWPWLKGQGMEHPCLRAFQRSLQEGNLQPVTCLN